MLQQYNRHHNRTCAGNINIKLDIALDIAKWTYHFHILKDSSVLEETWDEDMQRGLRAEARVMRHLCPTNHPNVRHISAGIRHTGPDPANQGWPGPWCWVINYDRTQIPDLETTSGTGLTCHTLGLMVTSVHQCLHCGGGTLYCTVLHCTVSLYCTVRGLDVTVAMICDWRGEARNGSGDYSPAINITTSSTEPDKDWQERTEKQTLWQRRFNKDPTTKPGTKPLIRRSRPSSVFHPVFLYCTSPDIRRRLRMSIGAP